jgi:hypothetical protein
MDKIVKAISHVFIVNALSSFPVNEKMAGKVGPVLCQKIKRMPLFIRISIYTSTYAFDWAGIFYGGRRFSVQNSGQQRKMLHVIERYNWHPLRQFLKFYQKASLYVYYSLLEELK